MVNVQNDTWLVEQGIGEDRAILMQGGDIAAARLDWPGPLSAGLIDDARLISRQAGSKRGTVRFESGEEALVSGLTRQASEGAPICVVVTRAAIAEKGRFKRAQCRVVADDPRPAPTLAERLSAEGRDVRVVHRFPDNEWNLLFAQVWDGTVEFSGGSLTISPTPAMTLIDVDGTAAPTQLALSAIPAIADAIRRFALAGSIGIDFPTLEAKADRQAVDEALSAALADWPHQRTAMNGFGFIQLVAKLERPSLLHRIGNNRASAAARLLMRQAEGVTDPGVLLLTAHPAVRAAVLPDWEEELARRMGRSLRWEADPALALHAGFAQAVV